MLLRASWKSRDYATKTRDYATKTRDYATKTRDYATKKRDIRLTRGNKIRSGHNEDGHRAVLQRSKVLIVNWSRNLNIKFFFKRFRKVEPGQKCTWRIQDGELKVKMDATSLPADPVYDIILFLHKNHVAPLRSLNISSRKQIAIHE